MRRICIAQLYSFQFLHLPLLSNSVLLCFRFIVMRETAAKRLSWGTEYRKCAAESARNVYCSLSLRPRIKNCVETTYYRVRGRYLHKVFRGYGILFLNSKTFLFSLNRSFHSISVSATIISSSLQTECQISPV